MHTLVALVYDAFSEAAPRLVVAMEAFMEYEPTEPLTEPPAVPATPAVLEYIRASPTADPV